MALKLVEHLFLVCAMVVLIGAGGMGALALSDWPAGFAVRYGLWRFSGQADEKSYTSDDARQSYFEAGHGPPLVLLHGGGGNRDAFFAQLPFLARHFHVFALDTRGHGRSAHGEGPLSYDRYADDVLRLLDQRRIDRVVLVGWSDGGNTGLMLALAHPERICRMVVISANFNPEGLVEQPEEPPPRSHAWASDLVEWLQGLVPRHGSENYPTEEELHDLWASGPDLSATDLQRISAPVLVVGGEYDVIDRNHLIATQSAIAGARLRIIPGVGHGVPQDAPVALNRALKRFLLHEDGSPKDCSTITGANAAPRQSLVASISTAIS